MVTEATEDYQREDPKEHPECPVNQVNDFYYMRHIE